ncbi:hypothetical protein GcC1_019036 [Golovinomyces cichoracearum]|uniref:Uncharacterized protein n=1 Tax=Golovinomyces cichoracearum TaxID=62708 RepID=A0A420J5E8_9PEZI|nr:hypothetical protein GcC1_019036 [Golovinomyces cichoracearum]
MPNQGDTVLSQEKKVQGDSSWGVDAGGTSTVKGLSKATCERFDKVETSLTIVDRRTIAMESTLAVILKNLEKLESKDERKKSETVAEPEKGETDVNESNDRLDSTEDEPNTRGILNKKKVYGGYNGDLNPDDSERDFDGSLNIYRMVQYPEKKHTKNESERFVKSIWTEVRIGSDLKGKGIQIKGLPDGAHKFKVYLDNSWKLVQASDVSVFHKLRQIQRALFQAAIPYDLWPVKFSLLLEGDFQVIQKFIDKTVASWPQSLEATFQLLDRHGTMRRPIIQFARLSPFQSEGYANFAWRLRTAFQELPRQPYFDSTIRDMLFETVKTYMPSVWSTIQPKIRMPTAQLVEEIVIQAGIIAQMPVEQAIYSKAGINVTLQGQSAPYYQYEISPVTSGAPGKAQIIQPNAISTDTGL